MRCLFEGVVHVHRMGVKTGSCRYGEVVTRLPGEHKKPLTVRIDTIIAAAGLTVKRKGHAKEIIKEVLKNLVDVGFLKAWKELMVQLF